MIYLGNNEIKSIHLGNTNIVSGFIGTFPFWGGEEPPVTNKARLVLSDSTVVEIPATGAGDTVLTQAEISSYQSDVAQVEVYSGVTEIGDNAFEACFSLTSVTLPNTLTTIGQSAFNSTPLQSIVIPNSVTSIGGNAFEYCGDLSAVTLPNSITTITNSCFSECSSLESIDIPASVTTIEQYAFHNNALTSITIPSAVTTIGTAAFKGGQSLQSIEVECAYPPALLRDDYGDWGYAFDNTNDAPIYVPCNSVYDYKSAEGWSDYEARISCHKQTMTPEFVVYYSKNEGDESDWVIFNPALVSLVDKIGVQDADLDWVEYEVPSDGIFPKDETWGILGIKLKSPAALDINLFNNTDFSEIDGGEKSLGVAAPWTRIYNSKNSPIVSRYTDSDTHILSISDDVQRVEDYGAANLNLSVQWENRLPTSLTYIGESAFNGCYFWDGTEDYTLSVPTGVTYIGDEAFANATVPVFIFETATPPTIGTGVFTNCVTPDNIPTPIYVPCEAVNAYKAAWAAWADRILCKSNIKAKLTLNDGSVVDIPFTSDYDNTINNEEVSPYAESIVSAEINDRVTSIGQSAFYGCGSLTAITIPDRVTSIGDRAFLNCTSLTSINIPSGVTEIADQCFYSGTSLQSITIPNSVTAIYYGAFSLCSSLTSVTIPSSVTRIGTQVFSECSSLTSITCEATIPPTMGGTVFYNTNNCPIYVPCSSVDAYKAAAGWSTYADRISCIPSPEPDPSTEYFHFISLADGSQVKAPTNLSYSLDGGNTWVAGDGAMKTLNSGATIHFKGTNSAAFGINHFGLPTGDTATSAYEVRGNIMSLCYGDSFENYNVLPCDGCFQKLFYRVITLKKADKLVMPFSAATSGCCESMFENCSEITKAPYISVTNVAKRCFARMFYGCRRMTTAPVLPATRLADSCYYWMFADCTSLTGAPALPATTLAMDCYNGMFFYCISITTPPALPASIIPTRAYNAMFMGCSSLTTAPVLSATTFQTSPSIISIEVYTNMFSNCSALTTAPELPATTIVDTCYNGMFSGCTSLTSAPALPATRLQNNCYNAMFKGCTSLTSAPVLPALTLKSGCYSNMFYGCTSLNYIKAMFTTTPSSSTTQNWVTGVFPAGTFVKNANATYADSALGLPNAWTVQTAEP